MIRWREVKFLRGLDCINPFDQTQVAVSGRINVSVQDAQYRHRHCFSESKLLRLLAYLIKVSRLVDDDTDTGVAHPSKLTYYSISAKCLPLGRTH